MRPLESLSRRKFALTGLLGSLAGLAGGATAAPARTAATDHGNGRLSMEEVAHRIEIDDLLTRYTIAVDDEDFDLLDTVFLPDAILDYSSAGGPRAPYPEVKAWLSRALSSGSPVRMHMLGNKQVIIEGSTARVRAYFFNPFVKEAFDGGYEYSLGGGYYNHRLVLTKDGWRSAELYEKRIWRQGFAPKPHPHNARSKEYWEFGGPARPRDATP
jgi:hypothetical protein